MQQVERAYFIGLDLGKSRDPSALAVVERRIISDIVGVLFGKPITRLSSREYILRDLFRFRLGTAYTLVAQTVQQRFFSPILRRPTMLLEEGREAPAPYQTKVVEPILCVDSTGLGVPVVDHLRDLQLHPVPMILTHGESPHPAAGGINVPKKDVVASLSLLIHTKRLKIAEGILLLQDFLRELKNFRVSTSPTGRDTYEASSGHDDLVLATALPLWYAELQAKRSPTPSLPRNFAAGFFQR